MSYSFRSHIFSPTHIAPNGILGVGREDADEKVTPDVLIVFAHRYDLLAFQKTLRVSWILGGGAPACLPTVDCVICLFVHIFVAMMSVYVAVFSRIWRRLFN